MNTGSYPIATFEATDVLELRAEFEQSVDEYLASCREDGVEPAAPFSGKLQLRLGSDLHRCVAQAATESGQSINSWISKVLAAQAQK